MKKLIAGTIVLMILVALPLSHLLMADQERETICHVTFRTDFFDRGHKIKVSLAALGAHFNHGDCETNPGPVGIGCACFFD